MSEKKITLAIETAVQGGSLSLLQGVSELDYQIGANEISNSQEILENINTILERNELGKKSIKKIVVSKGPGSFTGVRIGMAVGFGLKKALNCEMVGVPVLEAMLLVSKIADINSREVTTAIPIGGNQVCWQKFKFNNFMIVKNQISPKISIISDFINFHYKNGFDSKKVIILHRKLYLEFREKYESWLADNNNLLDAGENIAAQIGIIGTKSSERKHLQPIYVIAS